MKYIQCNSAQEVENVLLKTKGFKAAFVTPDFRIYFDMELYDEVCVIKMSPQTVSHLLDLQHILESNEHHSHEMHFKEIAGHAKDLQDACLNAVKAIKFKPMTKEKIHG